MNPIEAFETLDLRVGRVLRAEVNARARKPAYRLWIDFGPLGEKTSSAQLRARYSACSTMPISTTWYGFHVDRTKYTAARPPGSARV